MADAKTKSKKKSPEELRKELRELGKPDSGAPAKPPIDLKKAALRVGAVLVLLWIIAFGVRSVWKSWVPFSVVTSLTFAVIGVGIWAVRYVKKSERLGALLRGADSAEGRKDAISKLEKDFGKGDVQAVIARAQLEMQDDPRKALSTLETVDLGKQLQAVADQVRSMRAMIHLTLGEAAEARPLVDKLAIDKQQDIKTRAMLAIVASEAWARTGNANKAHETLDLFNPEEAALAEMRVQYWRARAFTYAANQDMKGVGRALRKLVEMNPQLLGMFVGQKRIHPLLEREAKQIFMRSGAVPRQVVRQRH